MTGSASKNEHSDQRPSKTIIQAILQIADRDQVPDRWRESVAEYQHKDLLS